jgi:hypothetical protein
MHFIQEDRDRELDIIYNLFYTARNCVFAECGDGSALIVTEKYKKLAGLFDKFNKENDSYFSLRYEYSDGICFSKGDESITFSDKLIGDNHYKFIVKFNIFYI